MMQPYVILGSVEWALFTTLTRFCILTCIERTSAAAPYFVPSYFSVLEVPGTTPYWPHFDLSVYRWPASCHTVSLGGPAKVPSAAFWAPSRIMFLIWLSNIGWLGLRVSRSTVGSGRIEATGFTATCVPASSTMS